MSHSPLSTTNSTNSQDHHVRQAAADLVQESKKMANGLYEDSKHKMQAMQHTIQDYSAEVAQHVHTKPLKSIFIAAGVGFLLSSLLKH